MPAALEGVIEDMWQQGWDPHHGNVDLFVRDFGLILCKSLYSQCSGGSLQFRSQTNLDHTSIWWPAQGIEAFPFHKIYKRLFSRSGESTVFFAAGVCALLRGQ